MFFSNVFKYILMFSCFSGSMHMVQAGALINRGWFYAIGAGFRVERFPGSTWARALRIAHAGAHHPAESLDLFGVSHCADNYEVDMQAVRGKAVSKSASVVRRHAALPLSSDGGTEPSVFSEVAFFCCISGGGSRYGRGCRG